MSIMDKLGKKLENVMSKSLTGESKEQYEKEKAARAEKQKIAEEAKAEVEAMAINASKEDLKDLSKLIQKSNFVDSNANWLAGFPNFRANYNAIAANLLTGKKNLRFLTQSEDVFYLLSVNDNKLGAYRIFNKNDVAKVETESKLLSKSFKITFKDGQTFSVDVTENKDKIKYFKSIL